MRLGFLRSIMTCFIFVWIFLIAIPSLSLFLTTFFLQSPVLFRLKGIRTISIFIVYSIFLRVLLFFPFLFSFAFSVFFLPSISFLFVFFLSRLSNWRKEIHKIDIILNAIMHKGTAKSWVLMVHFTRPRIKHIKHNHEVLGKLSYTSTAYIFNN